MDHTEPPPAIHSNDEYDNADAADDGHVHRVCVRTRQHSPRHGDVMPSLLTTSRRRLEQPPSNNISRPRSTRMKQHQGLPKSLSPRSEKRNALASCRTATSVQCVDRTRCSDVSAVYPISHRTFPASATASYLISMTTKAAPTARDNLP
jgi:hypothetical protein